MNNLKHIKISEFSRLSGISRVNLILYDKIGLLSPEYRGENGYRYYSHNQFSSAYLIYILRNIGVSIEEIKKYSKSRTPLKMLELFNKKEKDIDNEIKKLQEIKDVMKIYKDMVKDTHKEDIEKIQVKELKEIPMYLGREENISQKEYDEKVAEFYDLAFENNMNVSYPFGSIISKESLLNKNLDSIKQFYFLVNKGENSYRPFGKYVVGYMLGGYGDSHKLYVKLLNYIEENNLEICGDGYEEYPFNELSTINHKEYLIRVLIKVK